MKNFTQIQNTLIRSPSVSLRAKMLYIYLSSFNPCYPSRSRIYKDLKIGRRSLTDALDELQSLGLLTYVKGNSKKRSNKYTLNSYQVTSSPNQPLVLVPDNPPKNTNIKILSSSSAVEGLDSTSSEQTAAEPLKAQQCLTAEETEEDGPTESGLLTSPSSESPLIETIETLIQGEPMSEKDKLLAAVAALKECALDEKTREFIEALPGKYDRYGSLTDGQAGWLDDLVAKYLQPKENVGTTTPTVNDIRKLLYQRLTVAETVEQLKDLDFSNHVGTVVNGLFAYRKDPREAADIISQLGLTLTTGQQTDLDALIAEFNAKTA